MALAASTTLTIKDEMDADNGIGSLDTDFFYTGTGCIGIDVDVETLHLENTSVVTPAATDMSTATHIYAAMLCMTQPTLDIQANGGMGIGVIDSAGNWKVWFVGGKDTYNGGWDIRSAYTGNTHDAASATLPTMTDIVGITTYWKCLAKSKLSQNCFMDRTAYGNGAALTITGTNTTVDLGWSEVLSVADATDATRGYMKSQIGSYIAKGPLQIGDTTGTLTTDFSDDFNILVFPNQPVSATHNAVVGAGNATGSTDISLTSQVFKSAGERFALDMVDTNLTSLTITGSTLANAGLITFKAGQTVTSDVFNDCGQITPSTSTFESNTVSNYIGAEGGALLWPGGTTVNTCTFDNNQKSIEITQTASQTYDALLFVNEDNTTKQSTHLNNGGTDINISKNNGSNPLYYTATGGGVVTFVGASVTVKVTATTTDGTPIQSARVLLKASDALGAFPFDETVTIVNSGTTATVTHTAHGMATGDYVQITQGDVAANRGVFSIVVLSVDSYTYTMTSSPGVSPTGTIKATFVALYGLTDINGEIQISRVYNSNQNVTGWTRKSTISPFYQQGILTGSVSTITGYSSTAVMVSDE